MAGLGTVNSETGTYLSIAGGYIWDRKADESDPNYATQTYDKKDGEKGSRSGARYSDFEGNVVGVEFKTHQEYGESINVTLEAGEDRYIVSISTNNRNSQDFMKVLLKMDLEKPIYFKPYDFIDSDKRRAQGIVFRQDGEKIVLRNDDAPSKDSDWFKEASKKQIRRFFEDLTEWFVAEIEEKVCPKFSKEKAKATAEKEDTNENEEETETKTPKADVPKVTPIKMKRALKEYIKENYDGKELPKLSKDELVIWYNLSEKMEELPWEQEEAQDAEVPDSDLDAELEKLV